MPGNLGILVYQEQVQQAAKLLAGYTLGQADMPAPRHGKEGHGEDGEGTQVVRRGLHPHEQYSGAAGESDL